MEGEEVEDRLLELRLEQRGDVITGDLHEDGARNRVSQRVGSGDNIVRFAAAAVPATVERNYPAVRRP